MTDSEAYAEFRPRVQGMVEAAGGKMLVGGDIVEVIGGETPSGRHQIIVLEFPTVEQARGWDTLPQTSPPHAELRAMRDRAANVVLTVVSGD